MSGRRLSARQRGGLVVERVTQQFRASSIEARETWSAQNTAMFETAVASRHGARKRALAPAIGGLAILGSMFQLVSADVLAVNFTTSNDGFDVYSNYLDAAQAAGYLAPTNKYQTTEQGVVELGIKTAKLDGLCAIVNESLPAPLSSMWALKVSAGADIPDSYDTTVAPPTSVTRSASDGKLNGTSLAGAITADNLYLNASKLTGYGNLISGMNLGQSADTVATSAGLPAFAGSTGPQNGAFGLYVNQLNIGSLNGKSYGLNLAGQITLPKLKLEVVSAEQGQAACS